MYSKTLALMAGLAASASAFDCSGHYFSFFNRDGEAMHYERLDPALYPGTASPHLHSFDGGNGLSASSDYASLQASTCSTARVKTDKSLYWRPTLFFNKGGEFQRVPEKSTKIYYKYGDGNEWANVTGFPEDFGMLAGDPFKRADGDNPAGVRWACHQPNGGGDAIFANGFPKGYTSCNYGFATEVTFPSCWNGKKLDPANPGAHMAYPTGYSGVGIERCPTTHRAARFPTIFIEFWYDVSSFDGQYTADEAPWALSNGDPTGFGFHADFMNGWEKGVLEKATQETGGCTCGCGCGQKEMEECFGEANVNKDSDSEFQQCSAGSSSNDAALKFDTLPGCNPLQAGPARATMATGSNCDAAPAASKTSSGTSPSATSSAEKSESPAPTSDAEYTSVAEKDDSTLPTISVSLPKKEVDAKPTSAPGIPSDETLPSLTLVSSSKAAGQTGAPSIGNDDGECAAAVTVTYTPTVTITAGSAEPTDCEATVYTTLTEVSTVTIHAHQ